MLACTSGDSRHQTQGWPLLAPLYIPLPNFTLMVFCRIRCRGYRLFCAHFILCVAANCVLAAFLLPKSIEEEIPCIHIHSPTHYTASAIPQYYAAPFGAPRNAHGIFGISCRPCQHCARTCPKISSVSLPRRSQHCCQQC